MSDRLLLIGIVLGQASMVPPCLGFRKRHRHSWAEWRRIEEHYPSGRSKTRQIRRCRGCGREKVRDL